MAAPRRRLRVRREPAGTDPVRCDGDPLHCRCAVGPLPAPSRAPEIPAFISLHQRRPPTFTIPCPAEHCLPYPVQRRPPPLLPHTPGSPAFATPCTRDPCLHQPVHWRPPLSHPVQQRHWPQPSHTPDSPAFTTSCIRDPCLHRPGVHRRPPLHHFIRWIPPPPLPHTLEIPTFPNPYIRDPCVPHPRQRRPPTFITLTPPFTTPHTRDPHPRRRTPQTPLHAMQGGVTAFIARCPQAAYPASSSLLSWVRLGSPGVQARHTLPTSLQHSLQYWAPQAGTGQTRSWGVTGTPHTVQLWRIQRRSRGQRRQHHSSSNLPCSGVGTVWGSGQAAAPQGNRPGIRGQ